MGLQRTQKRQQEREQKNKDIPRHLTQKKLNAIIEREMEKERDLIKARVDAKMTEDIEKIQDLFVYAVWEAKGVGKVKKESIIRQVLFEDDAIKTRHVSLDDIKKEVDIIKIKIRKG